MQGMSSRPAQPVAAAPSGQAELASTVPKTSFRFADSLADTLKACWEKAAAPGGWNLSRAEFEAALGRSVAHRFRGAPTQPNADAIRKYLEGLHHADLALSCACAAGCEVAWESFVAQFRQELYRAARAISGTGSESDARELADSLYADLYGLRESEGKRRSLFDYFHGRSKLGTWLRAILAQRHVDAIRRARKLEPIEDETGDEHREIVERAQTAAPLQPEPDKAKYLSMLQAALAAALGILEARDRLRLAYYYADGRTLAEIGRLLREHEATASRKLERTRREVRVRVDAALRKEKQLSDAQVQLCYDYAREEWPFDLSAHLPATEAAAGDES